MTRPPGINCGIFPLPFGTLEEHLDAQDFVAHRLAVFQLGRDHRAFLRFAGTRR
jgi:hypothetical protein